MDHLPLPPPARGHTLPSGTLPSRPPVPRTVAGVELGAAAPRGRAGG
jgi:hypothetical protein